MNEVKPTLSSPLLFTFFAWHMCACPNDFAWYKSFYFYWQLRALSQSKFRISGQNHLFLFGVVECVIHSFSLFHPNPFLYYVFFPFSHHHIYAPTPFSPTHICHCTSYYVKKMCPFIFHDFSNVSNVLMSGLSTSTSLASLSNYQCRYCIEFSLTNYVLRLLHTY